MSQKLAIIGAGQAGFSVAAKIRALGGDHEITLIGKEASPPYQRPPLSKAYLKGEVGDERLWLRRPTYYADNAIDLRLGTEVTRIDRETKRVETTDGELFYDQLVLTTGSTPRRLPTSVGGDLQNVYYLRSVGDSRSLARTLNKARKLLIIGGGYVGLEVAAVTSRMGIEVTLLEAGERILQRVASAETSDYFRALHGANGVDIREGAVLEALEGQKVAHGARLSDGTRIDCDAVLVGIGAVPNDSLASEAGLETEGGIRADAFSRTSDAWIWTAGDVCSFDFRGQSIRLESVQNAIEQAELVARNILGERKKYEPIPWFWSDQFDVKLQIAGLSQGYDRTFVRGGVTPNAMSVWYYAGDRLLAIEAMNEPRSYMVGRKLLEKNVSPPPEAVKDSSVELRAFL